MDAPSTQSNPLSEVAKDQIMEGTKPSDQIRIGDTFYIVRPLNGKGMRLVFGLVKDMAKQIGDSTRVLGEEGTGQDKVARFVTSLTELLSDQIDKPLMLMYYVLQRGNASIDQKKFEEDINVIEDFAKFWEIFKRQNQIDWLLGKLATALRPVLGQFVKAATAESTTPTSPSSTSPTSLDGTTDGQSTSSSDGTPSAIEAMS